MQGPIAHIDRSSAGAVGTLVISRQSRRQSHFSLQSAAAEGYSLLRSALGFLREKDEPEIVTYVEERGPWDLPDDAASANVGLPLFITRLVAPASVVGGLPQLHLRPQFMWWGAQPWSGIYGYSPNPIFGGVYGQEWPYSLLYVTCPADVTVSTFTLPGITLGDLYQIEDTKELTAFLAQNAFLYDLLVEAHDKIVEFFGEDAGVYLELYEDPDYVCDRKLYAVIVTPLAAKDAIPLQKRLDDTWWLNNLTRARGKFNIIVEYV